MLGKVTNSQKVISKLKSKVKETKREERNMCKALEEYYNDGVAEGEMKGKAEGEQLFATLVSKMLADERIEEIKAASEDGDVRQQMYKEYGLQQKE